MNTIRGATTIKKNCAEEIKEASIELFKEIVNVNNLDLNKIVSMIFSCTKDITKDYPGKFIREHFNLKNTAIMHFNEMEVEGSLPLCIRILILIDENKKMDTKYIYLRDAVNLRKDLSSNQ